MPLSEVPCRGWQIRASHLGRLCFWTIEHSLEGVCDIGEKQKTLPFHPKGAEATLETNGRTDKRVGRTFQRTPFSGTGVFCPCDEAQLEGRLRDLDDEISEMRSSRDEVRRDTELQHGILRNQAADLRKRHEQAEDRAQEDGRKVVPNYSGFVRNPVKRLEVDRVQTAVLARLSRWSRSCTKEAWRWSASSCRTNSSWSRGSRVKQCYSLREATREGHVSSCRLMTVFDSVTCAMRMKRTEQVL